MLHRALLCCLLPLWIAAPTAAQVAVDAGAPTFPGFAPGPRTDAFLQDAGPAWRVRWDAARGVPALIYGGGLPRPFAGVADAERAARAVVDELSTALGYTSNELERVRVKPLALSRIGSSDKVVVKFRQVTSGVPTHEGGVSVLFSADGQLLAVDNGGLPHTAQVDRFATHGYGAAVAVARAAFVAETGQRPVQIEPGEYVLFPAPVSPGKSAVRAAPAYNVIVHGPDFGAAGLTIRNYVVAARGTPTILDSWDMVHDFDLDGAVEGWGQPGLLPDSVDSERLQVMQGVVLSADGEPSVVSGTDGSFSFPGVSTARTVTANLDGPFSRVLNDTGDDAVVSLTVNPGSPGTVTFNEALTETETAQVNAHVAIWRFRDWLQSIDPTETIFDFPVEARVNIDATCNAQWVGTHMRFFASGDGCANTAYSTVVYHEQGHWANALYGFGNSFTGIGEGGADVWAMYIADDPIVGRSFGGSGTYIRSGLNTTPFCGDESLGCYGESHANGLPLMGAVWKVRQRLKSALGNGPGSDAANLLMVSWYQTFTDTVLSSVILEHWLLLDDDNADLGDGTPHFGQINRGFVEQGFPSFQRPVFAMDATAADLVDHEGPVMIRTEITEVHDTVNRAELYWSADGGNSWDHTPLRWKSGELWEAEIPPQPSPAVVTWYVEALSDTGMLNWLPEKAPSAVFHFDRGRRKSLVSLDFEPLNDEGWAHQEIATQDDWQHGEPGGKEGDPSVAFSGTRIWGNDLGPDGFNGAYQANVHNELASPIFDMTGQSGVRLRFQRWLSVEKSEFDHAQVWVNDDLIWENPFDQDLGDQAWKFVDYDISAIADDNPSVQVRFVLVSDGGLEMGGWNIDDLELVSLGGVTEAEFTAYGLGVPGYQGGTPLLAGSGQTVPGGPLSMTVTGARPGAMGALFLGTDEAALPGLGGAFLVDPVIGQCNVVTDAGGQVTLGGVFPDDPNVSGLQFTLQFWAVDPDAVQGFSSSQGLKFRTQ